MVQTEIQTKKRHPKRSDQEWMDIIQECRSSGMSDKAWCAEHHIQPSKFYYHIRRLRSKACEIPAVSKTARQQPVQEIVRIQMDSHAGASGSWGTGLGRNSEEAAIRLGIAGCSVEIFNSAASDTILNTLTALQKLC